MTLLATTRTEPLGETWKTTGHHGNRKPTCHNRLRFPITRVAARVCATVFQKINDAIHLSWAPD